MRIPLNTCRKVINKEKANARRVKLQVTNLTKGFTDSANIFFLIFKLRLKLEKKIFHVF